MKQEYFRVGVITSPHGIRGELRVFPTTDDPSRFRKLKEVYLERNGSRTLCGIEQVRFQKGMVLLKLDIASDRNAAELLRNAELYVDRNHAVPLEEGEHYIADLIGLPVVTDEGESIGILDDIMQTGANDVYAVRSALYGEVLIPSIPQCILDISEERILVHLLPGLLPEK